MKTAIEILRELGVSFRGSPRRSFKTVCPKCSHGRKNKSDPCLSVRVDDSGVVGHCHHCAWSFGRHYNPHHEGTKKTIAKTSTVTYRALLSAARSHWR
jgi:hypothetical protein